MTQVTTTPATPLELTIQAIANLQAQPKTPENILMLALHEVIALRIEKTKFYGYALNIEKIARTAIAAFEAAVPAAPAEAAPVTKALKVAKVKKEKVAKVAKAPKSVIAPAKKSSGYP